LRIPPWAVFVLVAGAAGLFASCGKKGPLILPERQMTMKVEALSAETKDGILFLEGRVVSKAEEGGGESAGAAGCKIDRIAGEDEEDTRRMLDELVQKKQRFQNLDG